MLQNCYKDCVADCERFFYVVLVMNEHHTNNRTKTMTTTTTEKILMTTHDADGAVYHVPIQVTNDKEITLQNISELLKGNDFDHVKIGMIRIMVNRALTK